MRHIVVIVVVICTVIGDGWAQNRGGSRYAASEDYDGESTRAPRPAPSRGPGLRRQRTTKAPEVPAVEDDLKSYQPPESLARTTARRVPQRESSRQLAPPPPPPVPAEEKISLYSPPGSGTPESPPTGTEGRPQGTRRRRPKKRRKPQAEVSKVDDQSEKQMTTVSENDKAEISELLNEDRKRTEEFQSNTQLRNAPPNFDSNPNNFHPEKASWDNPGEQPQRNAAGPQYFRPQSATNRLPIGDSEQVGNSGYLGSAPIIPDVDSPNQYAPKEPTSGVRNEASYVPVLNPIRVPSEGGSRLPHEDYLSSLNKESTRPLPSDRNIPFRSHGNRFPGTDANQVIRNTGSRPIHNNIPQPDEPVIPIRGHSGVRLPEDERPIEYGSPNFDPVEGLPPHLEHNAKVSDENEEQANPTNRLPNPSEIHYDSVYPEFSDNPQRTAGRRQESDEANARRTLPSHSSPRRESGTKPQEYDNDAEVDRRQTSQYQPPLQRTGSRYRSDDLDESTRSRAPQPSSTAPPRGRGSVRHQPSTDNTAPERTRSLTRRPVESVDSPSRTRSASTSESTTRTRGTPRYVPETIESAPRTSSRRQQGNEDTQSRGTRYTPPAPAHVPDDEIIRNEQRASPHSSRPLNPPPSHFDVENHPDDYYPVRNTLRSSPQYEVRDTEPINAYEDSVEDPNSYNNEYQQPRQPTTRGRTTQRPPVIRQEPPQSGYQQSPNRQQTRSESHYEPPQNPRSRQQPQYQAPQNPRTDNRQASSRQSAPSPRQQIKPRHQDAEPPVDRSRSSGGSNFRCPYDFGFFADPVQCDKYYECRNGTAEMKLCDDGLAFNDVSAPKIFRCDSLRDVDCKSRPELQEPQSTRHCPRRFGLFAHESDCTKFWNCVDGTDSEVQCPPGLTYNDDLGACDWADLSVTSCKSEDLLGFTCPEPTAHDLLDGVYSRYPHKDNCQLHFTCIKGADGLRRPRLLSCNEGQVFDPATSACKRPEEVPGCEEFYGPRPLPKRKPAPRQPAPREPEPEEEELIEEPTPRPRRRGTNRRARN